jgi:hypothetical protein
MGKRSIAAAAALAAILGACGSADVVGKYAAESFGAVAEAAGGKVAFAEADAAWSLESAAGDRVRFAADFSAGTADVAFDFDAAPFLEAGLDPAKLAGSGGVAFAVEGGRLAVRFDLGDAAFGAAARGSIRGTFEEILKARRDAIGYHAQLDHYGIALGGGNMFEWAKDLSKNDKDIVWVLDPAPFLAAGADPAKVAGWVFGTVEVMDGAKKVQVQKLLKPFDLR